MSVAITEESALINVYQPAGPSWASRLDDAEPFADVGALFAINSMVLPVGNSMASLVAPEAIAGVADWLASTHATLDDGIVGEVADTYIPDVAFCSAGALAERLGLTADGFDFLPPPWTAWRVDCEVFILVDRVVYTLGESSAERYKTLTRRELGLAYSNRLLPFADKHEPGALVFIVVIPARRSSVGGLRGQRTALVRAGVGLEACRRGLPGDSSWEWHTEFFDDAACNILGVDGVEAIPIAIGRWRTTIDGAPIDKKIAAI